jgi:hypothetical protein
MRTMCACPAGIVGDRVCRAFVPPLAEIVSGDAALASFEAELSPGGWGGGGGGGRQRRGGAARLLRRGGKFRRARIERSSHRRAHFMQEFADFRPLFLGEVPHLLARLRETPGTTRHGHAGLLECGQIRRASNVAQRLLAQSGQFLTHNRGIVAAAVSAAPAFRQRGNGVPRLQQNQAAFSAAAPRATICLNVSSSATARSASILRLMAMDAFFRPSIKRL